jgi:mRNA-degrading endonuclease YafQ of YafQ-DinJ toxin-antitoxin module
MYKLVLHHHIQSEDLVLLLEELQKKFIQYQKVLKIDPYQTKGMSSHNLQGNLKNYRALEIDFEGTSYRLVYRVYNSSSPRYINIISFGEHDLAYERAIARK